MPSLTRDRYSILFKIIRKILKRKKKSMHLWNINSFPSPRPWNLVLLVLQLFKIQSLTRCSHSKTFQHCAMARTDKKTNKEMDIVTYSPRGQHICLTVWLFDIQTDNSTSKLVDWTGNFANRLNLPCGQLSKKNILLQTLGLKIYMIHFSFV